MISFNCKMLLSENLDILLKTTEQILLGIQTEINNINTLLVSAPSLQLKETDFLFYNQRLRTLLNDNKELLDSFLSLHTLLNNLSCQHLQH